MLTMVIALGALGIGYAAWTDTVVVTGTINAGSVCLSFEPGTYHEIYDCGPSQFATLPDMNWSGWVTQVGSTSCPDGYKFQNKPCSDKDVASITSSPVLDAAGNITAIQVTINNAYPHYLGHYTFEVCNCGTIPIKINAPVFNQNPSLLIEYRNGTGTQLEPGGCHEVSFFVGVTQHQGYWSNGTSGTWIVDDPSKPLTPQNSKLSFTIDVSAIQWNEYGVTG
jgi:predicted ribosomally synthesized peptide with SipW-like signal peptide